MHHADSTPCYSTVAVFKIAVMLALFILGCKQKKVLKLKDKAVYPTQRKNGKWLRYLQPHSATIWARSGQRHTDVTGCNAQTANKTGF